MSDFSRPSATVDRTARRRPAGSRFAGLGDRLARTFGAYERPIATSTDVPEWESNGDLEYHVAGPHAPVPAWDSRFPMARHGYDCDAVDDYIAELERELSILRNGAASAAAIDAEIGRVGEQTAAILRVAHEQAREITRKAQCQADNVLNDAAANAVKMTEDSQRRLRELDGETDAVWRERMRLIEDVRSVATSLFSLAEDAVERFPAEGERTVAVPPVVAAGMEPAVDPGVEVRPDDDVPEQGGEI